MRYPRLYMAPECNSTLCYDYHMASDDSPQLGGQADDANHDASPMISSVQTRVIVSARGAYTVGNLEALIELMNDDQQLQFRKIIFRHASAKVIQALRQLPEAECSDEAVSDLRPIAEAVAQWAHGPEAVVSEELEDYADGMSAADDSRNIVDAVYMLVDGLVDEDDPYNAADKATIAAVNANPHGRRSLNIIARDLIEGWHLEVVWHLLSGLPAPADPPIDPHTLETLAHDTQRMYQARNLDALLEAMNVEQQSAFSQLILKQTLRLVKALLVKDESTQQMYPWLDLFEVWVDTDQAIPYGRIQAIQRTLAAPRPQSPSIISALSKLCDVFNSHDPLIGEPYYLAWRSQLAIGYAASASDTGIDWTRAEKAAHSWQVEAAWATLHDGPIPPLEIAS
jgi:hypothetical protein